MLFTNDEQLVCTYCPNPRFKDPPHNKKPVAQITYVSLGETLGSLLMNEKYRQMFRETYNRRNEDTLTDIFDGSIFKTFEHLFPGEFDTAVALYVDGFMPFRHNKTKVVSMTIVHLVFLNLPITERYSGFVVGTERY